MEKLTLLKLFSVFGCKTDGVLTTEALALLQEWGLVPIKGTYFCSEGHPLKLVECTQSIDGFVWRCWKQTKGKKPKKCDERISLRVGTFFDKTKLPIFKVIGFCHLWLKNVTQDFIMEELELSRHTADDWSSFCREVVYDGMVYQKEKIGGSGVVAEIDESKFGRRKYHRGHRVEGQWVFGGVERGSNRCFLVPVEKRDTETLLEIIKEWILTYTTIVSDCWKVYDCLSDEGFIHFQVNHSVNFKDPETNQHTNTIEGMLSVLCHSFIEKRSFYGYLAKYIFLRNCKSSPVDNINIFMVMAGRLYDPRKPSLYFVEEEEEDEYEIDIE